jgi:mycofactocin precursor
MSEQVETIEVATQTVKSADQAHGPAPDRAAVEAAQTAQQPVVALQDLLVEEVSIDGMCGVY